MWAKGNSWPLHCQNGQQTTGFVLHDIWKRVQCDTKMDCFFSKDIKYVVSTGLMKKDRNAVLHTLQRPASSTLVQKLRTVVCIACRHGDFRLTCKGTIAKVYEFSDWVWDECIDSRIEVHFPQSTFVHVCMSSRITYGPTPHPPSGFTRVTNT